MVGVSGRTRYVLCGKELKVERSRGEPMYSQKGV